MVERFEKNAVNLAWKKKLIFAGVFVQENMLHAVMDRYSGFSCKQWLLMAVCEGFDSPPDLTTIARTIGCSRQNVKKLALQLEEEEYLELIRSDADARSLCLHITEKGREFLKGNARKAAVAHNILFSEFTDEEVEQYYEYNMKMMRGIEKLEETLHNHSS